MHREEAMPIVSADEPTAPQENRFVAIADDARSTFSIDNKDAGEIGAGHSVTAMYEIVPTKGGGDGKLMDVVLHYKHPTSDESKPLDFTVEDRGGTLAQHSDDFHFAAAVAQLGMLLRNSEHAGLASFGQAIKLAKGSFGSDAWGRRTELVGLIEMARDLSSARG